MVVDNYPIGAEYVWTDNHARANPKAIALLKSKPALLNSWTLTSTSHIYELPSLNKDKESFKDLIMENKAEILFDLSFPTQLMKCTLEEVKIA